MNRKELIVAVAMSAVLAITGTNAAVGADPGFVDTGGGLDGGPVVRTAARQARYDQKVKLAQEYAAVGAGTLDYATFKPTSTRSCPRSA